MNEIFRCGLNICALSIDSLVAVQRVGSHCEHNFFILHHLSRLRPDHVSQCFKLAGQQSRNNLGWQKEVGEHIAA